MSWRVVPLFVITIMGIYATIERQEAAFNAEVARTERAARQELVSNCVEKMVAVGHEADNAVEQCRADHEASLAKMQEALRACQRRPLR